MKITTKTANGRITAYYVDGKRVRRDEIVYRAHATKEIVEIDYYTAKNNFPTIFNGLRNIKVVFTGDYGEGTMMTKTAADALNMDIVKEVSYNLFRVAKKAEVDPGEYAISDDAFQIALDAEILAADSNNFDDAIDSSGIAVDYQQTLATVNAQLTADNFDYVAAKEHIENVYEDIQTCIEFWGHYHGLTPSQCEQIYIALHVNSEFYEVNAELRDQLIEQYKARNCQQDDFADETDNTDFEDSLTRAMKDNLERFQEFCKVGNLTAANNELVLYNICRKATRDLLRGGEKNGNRIRI